MVETLFIFNCELNIYYSNSDVSLPVKYFLVILPVTMVKLVKLRFFLFNSTNYFEYEYEKLKKLQEC